jgi:iron complex outermembrane recepter protein
MHTKSVFSQPAHTWWALSVAAAMPAVAQTQEQHSAPVLEEVVVTAEHREASLQDTQISMTALPAAEIQELGISNGADIGRIVPNVTINELASGRSGYAVNMRGIGQNESLLTFDPAIGLYIDDVLISKSTGSMMDVLDMERIEVLRGPQGTLYGRNTMGGTLNIVTKKPTNEFGGNLKATLGSYGQRDLRGILNVPLTGADSAIGPISMKVSAATLNRDGLLNNVAANRTQDELATRNRDIATLQLLWQPTDQLEVMYSYDVTRIDEIPDMLLATVANLDRPSGVLVQPYLESPNERPGTVEVGDYNFADTKADGHSLRFDYDIAESLNFKSITAYRSMENTAASDTDGTPMEVTGTEDAQSYDFFSQEFRLVGTALDERLDYTLGLFYMDESGDVDAGTRISGRLSRAVAEFDNMNWALYGQTTYSLTDKWKLTGGIRYTQEEREMTKINVATSGAVQVFPEASGSYDNVSPMVSVSYDWSEDVMTYLKVSTGFQSGGFNSRDSTVADFLRGFDEETLTAYEAGIKSYLGDRIRLNAALWFSDYKDKRVNMFNPETLASVVRNAGVVEIYGAEVELVAKLSDQWQLGVNYGYVKPEYTKYDAPDPVNPSITRDLSQTTAFPYTPEHDANVNLTYEVPLSFALLSARVDWSYKDEMNFLAALPERNSQKAYDLWNARLSLRDIAGPVDTTMRVSAWVKNVTDKAYWNQGVASFAGIGFDKNVYGEPRTYGVDFTFDF